MRESNFNEENLIEHLNKYYHNHKDIPCWLLDIFAKTGNKYHFDLENCPTFTEEYRIKYKTDEVEFSTLPAFQGDEGLKLQSELIASGDLSTEVYCWMFGYYNTEDDTDYIVWGNTLQEFISFLERLFEYRMKKNRSKKSTSTMECWIHNISYEKNFFSWYFLENGFKQVRIHTEEKEINKKNVKVKSKQEVYPKTFDITENDGVVYTIDMCLEEKKYSDDYTKLENFKYDDNVYIPEGTKVRKRRSDAKIKEFSFIPKIVFKDLAKVIANTLENISKQVIDIDKMFQKDKEIFQYHLQRNPSTYNPMDNPLQDGRYTYSDIYIMKETYKQYIKGQLIDTYGVKNIATASSTAFESILAKTYEDNEELKEKVIKKKMAFYKRKGKDVKPEDIKVEPRDIYEDHYCIKLNGMKDTIKEIDNFSYAGGHCTVAPKYRQKATDYLEFYEKHHNDSDFEQQAEKYKISGCSTDICSSYPHQMTNKPLPYGMAEYGLGKPPIGKGRKNRDGQKLEYFVCTVMFSGWMPKCTQNDKNKPYYNGKDIQMGLPFKIGKIKSEADKIAINYTASRESYVTNITSDGRCIGSNRHEPKVESRIKAVENLERLFGTQNFLLTVAYDELKLWMEIFQFKFKNKNTNSLDNGILFVDWVGRPTEVGHFAKGIDFFYKIKEAGALAKNNTMKLVGKVNCNSFYGKHCSRSERKQSFYKKVGNHIVASSRDENGEDNYWEDTKLFDKSLGSATTSRARIQLMETAFKIGLDRFIYSDTDSIKEDMTREEFMRRCKETNIDITYEGEDSRLGSWSFEFEFEDFHAIGQKKYMYKEKGKNSFKCKCAGLPSSTRALITEKHMFGVTKSFIKPQKARVRNGCLILNQKFTIHESFYRS